MDTSQSELSGTSPLTLQELQRIEATHLPVLDRHHLRLLAHCLAVFQQISGRRKDGPLPSPKAWELWCIAQPNMAADQEFRDLLLRQLQAAATQLEAMASQNNCTPLELDLDDLITIYSNDCRQRLEMQDLSSSRISQPMSLHDP